MNLETLHQYLGQLLSAGMDPKTPTTAIVEGEPKEISDAYLVHGMYYYDPHPKMPANVRRNGTVLALLPINEDISDALNEGRLKELPLPVEAPYPD